MRDRPFLDSNILIYSISTNDPRSATAAALIDTSCVISTQVLNEFVSVARRKLKWSWPEIMVASTSFQELFPNPVLVGFSEHRHALRIAEHDGIAFYDALIVASALAAGCSTLLTEDMQDGRVVEGRLTIRNPFPVVRGM